MLGGALCAAGARALVKVKVKVEVEVEVGFAADVAGPDEREPPRVDAVRLRASPRRRAAVGARPSE